MVQFPGIHEFLDEYLGHAIVIGVLKDDFEDGCESVLALQINEFVCLAQIWIEIGTHGGEGDGILLLIDGIGGLSHEEGLEVRYVLVGGGRDGECETEATFAGLLGVLGEIHEGVELLIAIEEEGDLEGVILVKEMVLGVVVVGNGEIDGSGWGSGNGIDCFCEEWMG